MNRQPLLGAAAALRRLAGDDNQIDQQAKRMADMLMTVGAPLLRADAERAVAMARALTALGGQMATPAVAEMMEREERAQTRRGRVARLIARRDYR